jgi:predicted nucleic acid-binding protein
VHLLDTGVVWELRQARAGTGDPGLAAWAAGVPRTSLFVSAVTLLELEAGTAQVERRDKAAGAAMRGWIDTQLPAAFADRILAVDAAVVRRWGQLAYPDLRDGLLAATALEHRLTLVTRDTAAFRTGRVKVFNPSGYVDDTADGLDWRQAGRGGGPQWLRSLFVRG